MANEDFITQQRATVWVQPEGTGTPFKLLGLGKTSVTGRSQPGPTKTAVYGSDRFGRPVVQFTTLEPPGGLPTKTIGWYDEASVAYMDKQRRLGCPFYTQVRIAKCGSVENPNNWDVVDHYARGLVGDITPGDGPATPYGGAAITRTAVATYEYTIRLLRTALSALTSGSTTQINDIAVVSDPICGECGNGYPGPDKIMWFAGNAGAGAKAKVYYSVNGGSTFAASSADAFENDEHINGIEWMWIDSDTIRLIISCATTDAGAKPKVAYADVSLSAPGTTVWNVTVSTSASAANGETVAAMAALFFDRIYITSSAGELYVITDQAETWSDAALVTGTNALTVIVRNHEGTLVYAAGASNTILREQNQNGTFAARVGPSGGGAFTALAVANDGTLYAGNGTSLYKSVNGAADTAGWTQLKDFGTSHAVKAIILSGGEDARGGDPQAFRVVVDDATPGNGEVWETLDGGATFRPINEVTNGGYNAAVGSLVDDNKMWIVGDTSGGAGVVHLLTA